MTSRRRALRQAGAVVVDPADLPSLSPRRTVRRILLDWPICFGEHASNARLFDRAAVRHEARLQPLAELTRQRRRCRRLTELRAWNAAHEADGAIEFGQGQLDASDAIDLRARRGALSSTTVEKDLQLTRTEGIDAVLRAHTARRAAVPRYLGAAIGARAGYPSIIVPFTARAVHAAVRRFPSA